MNEMLITLAAQTLTRHRLKISYTFAPQHMFPTYKKYIHIQIMLFLAVFLWVAPCDNVLQAYADSEGPDQTAHPRSLIWAFAVRK